MIVGGDKKIAGKKNPTNSPMRFTGLAVKKLEILLATLATIFSSSSV